MSNTKEIPKEVFNVRIKPEVLNCVKSLAEIENRSQSNMLETILERYFIDGSAMPDLIIAAEFALSKLVRSPYNNKMIKGLRAALDSARGVKG